jgi:hypothetical protein
MIAFLSAFFPTVAAWLISLIGRKTAVFTVSITAFLTATSAFLILINSLVQSILNSLVLPLWIEQGIGLFLPYSFTFDLSVMIGAYSARWVYDTVLAKISLINTAT